MHSEELFRQAADRLEKFYGKQEAQSLSFLLLQALYGWSRSEILATKQIPDLSKLNILESYLNRLEQSEPLQYILGQTEFYGYPFEVNPSVLIPRPETEELVQWIISENKNKATLSILDIGTGSGCIAIALKKNLPQATVYALDVSTQALETAKKNALLNQAEINFIDQNILSDTTGIPRTNIIVSNPPYVMEQEKPLMRKNVLAYEPSLALFVEDQDPLLFYRTIAEKAAQYLVPQGKIYFEINEQFGKETAELLTKTGFVKTRIMKDLSGKDRMVGGELN
ncbi:MAG TPA: peptide chain release factor N(5)-glutamine methyltransferase [Cytophagaceae bacterium]|jgi:release factor glutamine methyltransferase|nr:peptide chain release factor N(5)-glutamine methyltransferase [Cytophagaceae bacterium]